MQKFFNEPALSTSNNKKALIDKELASAFMDKIHTAEKKLNKPMGVICAINYNNEIYALFIEPERIAARIRRGGKVLCPVGKNQLADMIASNSPYIKYMGSAAEFSQYRDNINIKASNNGKPMQKFIAHKLHKTTDLNACLSNGGDGIVYGGRVNEVKLFDFTKTTGTPSATSDK